MILVLKKTLDSIDQEIEQLLNDQENYINAKEKEDYEKLIKEEHEYCENLVDINFNKKIEKQEKTLSRKVQIKNYINNFKYY